MPDGALDELRAFLDERKRTIDDELAAQDYVANEIYPILERAEDLLKERRLFGATDYSHAGHQASLSVGGGLDRAWTLTYTARGTDTVLCTTNPAGGAEETSSHRLGDITPQMIEAEVTAFVKRALG